MGVAITNICLRRPERVEHAACESLRFAQELSLSLFHGYAQIHHGWALSELGSATGCVEIEDGLREKHQAGAQRLEQFDQSLAADAYSRAGRHNEALTSISRAFESLAFGGDKAFAAELHRKRALLLLRADGSERDAAEADLQRALAIARQQSALSLELRAARDLARLWSERGERQQAADLLAPLYAAFTEGFHTPDLQESKALLAELTN